MDDDEKPSTSESTDDLGEPPMKKLKIPVLNFMEDSDSNMSGNGLSILEEEHDEMDRELEEKSQRVKMTAKNVKSLLHQVITNEQVLDMVRNTLQEEGMGDQFKEAIFEPKMTRSKLKEVFEKGELLPNWNLPSLKPLADPMKKPHFLEMSFSDTEENEDDEYRPAPDEIAHASDDEDNLSSVFSDLGSPAASITSAPCTPASVRDKSICDTPSHSEPPEESDATIARRTRSKLPLTDTPLEVIESTFVAPDITADMYDTACDDTDWQHFLTGLTKTSNNDDNEEDNDPEYNFLGDAEVEEEDVEDYRNDKAVKISKREVNELMEELFDAYDEEDEDSQGPTSPLDTVTAGGSKEKSNKSKKKSPSKSQADPSNEKKSPEANSRESSPSGDSDGSPSSTQNCPVFVPPLKLDGPLATFLVSDMIKLSDPNTEQSSGSASVTPIGSVISEDQVMQIRDQMRKHIQLLAQSHVQASLSQVEDLNIQTAAQMSKLFLLELEALGDKSAAANAGRTIFHEDNLKGAIEITDSDFSQGHAIKNDILKSCIVKAAREDANFGTTTYMFSFEQMEAMMSNRVFMYPQMLPEKIYHTGQPPEKTRVCFTEAEDNLLAIGMSQFGHLTNKYLLIRECLMPSKKRFQLKNRIKNLKGHKHSTNAMQVLEQTGGLPSFPKYTEIEDSSCIVPPKNRDPDLLPKWAIAFLNVETEYQNACVQRMKDLAFQDQARLNNELHKDAGDAKGKRAGNRSKSSIATSQGPPRLPVSTQPMMSTLVPQVIPLGTPVLGDGTNAITIQILAPPVASGGQQVINIPATSLVLGASSSVQQLVNNTSVNNSVSVRTSLPGTQGVIRGAQLPPVSTFVQLSQSDAFNPPHYQQGPSQATIPRQGVTMVAGPPHQQPPSTRPIQSQQQLVTGSVQQPSESQVPAPHQGVTVTTAPPHQQIQPTRHPPNIVTATQIQQGPNHGPSSLPGTVASQHPQPLTMQTIQTPHIVTGSLQQQQLLSTQSAQPSQQIVTTSQHLQPPSTQTIQTVSSALVDLLGSAIDFNLGPVMSNQPSGQTLAPVLNQGGGNSTSDLLSSISAPSVTSSQVNHPLPTARSNQFVPITGEGVPLSRCAPANTMLSAAVTQSTATPASRRCLTPITAPLSNPAVAKVKSNSRPSSPINLPISPALGASGLQRFTVCTSSSPVSINADRCSPVFNICPGNSADPSTKTQNTEQLLNVAMVTGAQTAFAPSGTVVTSGGGGPSPSAHNESSMDYQDGSPLTHYDSPTKIFRSILQTMSTSGGGGDLPPTLGSPPRPRGTGSSELTQTTMVHAGNLTSPRRYPGGALTTTTTTPQTPRGLAGDSSHNSDSNSCSESGPPPRTDCSPFENSFTPLDNDTPEKEGEEDADQSSISQVLRDLTSLNSGRFPPRAFHSRSPKKHRSPRKRLIMSPRQLLPKPFGSPTKSTGVVLKDSPTRKALNKRVRTILPKGMVPKSFTSPAKSSAAAIAAKARQIAVRQNSNRAKVVRRLNPVLLPKPEDQQADDGIINGPTLLVSREALERALQNSANINADPNDGDYDSMAEEDFEGDSQDDDSEVEGMDQEDNEEDDDDIVIDDDDDDDEDDAGEMDDLDDREEVKPDDIHLEALMTASTTIQFKSNVKVPVTTETKFTKGLQKQQDLINSLAPDIIETDPLRDERDTAFAKSFLCKARELLSGDKEVYDKFLKLLHDFSLSDNNPVQLYEKMAALLPEFPELVEDFSAFLLPEQARECRCFMANHLMERARRFLRKVEIHLKKKPSHLIKFTRALAQWKADGSDDLAGLLEQVQPVLGSYPHLLDELASFFSNEAPPKRLMTDFEDVDISNDDELEMYKPDEFEEVNLGYI